MVGLILALALSAPVSGQEKTAPFVIGKKGTSPELLSAVRDATFRAAVSVLRDSVIPEAVVRERLGDRPEKKIEKCGANLGCIAKLGAKAGGAKVLYTRVVPAKKRKPIQVQLLVIGVTSRLIEQRTMVEFKNVAEVRSKLVDQIYAMLSVNGPGYIEITGATTEVTIDGQVVGNGSGTYTVTPGRHDVLVAGVSASVLVLPGGFERLNITAPASTPASAPAIVYVETPTAPATIIVNSNSEKRTRGTTWMLPTGGAIAGAGGVAIGMGIFFGLQSNNTRAKIRQGATSQISANNLNNEANGQANTATALFVAGGIAMGIGAGMIIADLILSGNEEEGSPVTPIAALTEGGAFGGIHARF